MKKFLLYTLFTFLILTSNAQYYLRGEVRDDKNVLLQNVKIFLFSNHLLCYSGNEGTFGISTPLLYDSMSLSLDGYETKTIWINANQFQSIVLKSTSSNVSDNSKKTCFDNNTIKINPLCSIYMEETNLISLLSRMK
ncbi:MAG: hypothetical protein WDM71_05790 [Ferruginibacter sp.]